MSADNGIYILKTPSTTSLGIQLNFFEYRVIVLRGDVINRIYVDNTVFTPQEGVPINSLELVRYFGKAKPLGERGSTLFAEEKQKEISYLQPRFQIITLNKPFDEYMVEAGKELVAMRLYEMDYPGFADSTKYEEWHWRKETPGKRETYFKKADEVISLYQDPTQE